MIFLDDDNYPKDVIEFFRKKLLDGVGLSDAMHEYAEKHGKSDKTYDDIIHALARMEENGEVLVSGGNVYFSSVQ